MTELLLYVSADGPLRSLTAARDAIRNLKAAPGWTDRPVTVRIEAGVYELEETFRLTPEDSGTPTCPVSYVAAEGAAPVVSGGRRISNWRETEYNGLRCWTAELPEVAAGGWSFTRLYVNAEPRPRPRLPKIGFHRFAGLPPAREADFRWGNGPDRATFAAGDIRHWHNWQDVELISYELWFSTHHRFKEIDEAARTVHFHTRGQGRLKDEKGEFARYFVENVFEALDTPGQWYLDRAAGRLYYLPLPHETLATTAVVAPRLSELVRLQGDGTRTVRHVHFENIAFAHQQWVLPSDCAGYVQAAFGVPGAIILQGAERCVFYGCSVAHINGYGIEVLTGSTENVIAACSIRDAGAGGVKVGHEQLLPHGGQVGMVFDGEYQSIATTVVDCTIHDIGHIYPGAPGIWVGNSGWNRLLHNHIFDAHWIGISCGWTWGYAPTRTVANLIAHNHIHHINHRQHLSDNGGIYTLGIQPGTVLRGNFIHDIASYHYGGWGIYPDEGSSEIRIEQNVVLGTQRSAYGMHYGRDVLVENNIFALSREHHLNLGKQAAHRSTLCRRNIILTANGRIEGTPSWEPGHSTMRDNIHWAADGTVITFNGEPLADQQARGQHPGAVVADPLFTDAGGGDFSLRRDSPVFAAGFKAFDWRTAGPRLGGARPADFAGYLRQHPLPPHDRPVLRTRIEIATSEEELARTGVAMFQVFLSNVGRSTTQGTLRLTAGPAKVAGSPSPRRIAYDLPPGAETRHEVTVKVRRHRTDRFWLESEPSGHDGVPALKLLLAPVAPPWRIPLVPEPAGPEDLAHALRTMPVRELRAAHRPVAQVRLAASASGLLFHGLLHERKLRPNLTQPWFGTGFELLGWREAAAGAPPPVRHQVFLMPGVDGKAADALHKDLAAESAEPAPAIRVLAKPAADGCEVAAIIPWHELGEPQCPVEMMFELIADTMAPDGKAICQTPALDPNHALPADGWRRQYGRLVVEQDSARGMMK